MKGPEVPLERHYWLPEYNDRPNRVILYAWWQISIISGAPWRTYYAGIGIYYPATLVENGPQLVARRAKNLRDHLTRSQFMRAVHRIGTGQRLKGTHQCGRCSICPFIKTVREVFNPTTKKGFGLYEYMNCRSKGLVYALRCPCRKIYVGQTSQELRRRVQHHISNINLAKRDMERGKTLTSVAKHFLQKESRWIFRLGSCTPNGMNEELLFTGFYRR